MTDFVSHRPFDDVVMAGYLAPSQAGPSPRVLSRGSQIQLRPMFGRLQKSPGGGERELHAAVQGNGVQDLRDGSPKGGDLLPYLV